MDEEDGGGHLVEPHNHIVVSNMLVSKGGNDLRYEVLVGFEVELGIFKQDIESLLEVEHKVLLHNFPLQVCRQVLVESVLSQERIRTLREVLVGVLLPLEDVLTWYFPLWWKLSANFDNQVVDDLDHVICVFARRDVVARNEALELLDGHRVEKHANELQD